MSETGVIKFTCEDNAVTLPMFDGFDELNACRRKLLQLRLIGVDRNRIGFGNLSVRAREAEAFYITGSGTGGFAQLRLEHFAKVTAYDFDRNWICCEGRTVASSESLTHAAIYEADPAAMAVIHCHSESLWKELLRSAPATAGDVEYGTPEMAYEVQRLFATSDVKARKAFAMSGHEAGVVAFGTTLNEAVGVLLAHIPRSSS